MKQSRKLDSLPRSLVTINGAKILPVRRRPGRPPNGSETAAVYLHMRVMPDRKRAWAAAAGSQSLAAWVTAVLDRTARYRP